MSNTSKNRDNRDNKSLVMKDDKTKSKRKSVAISHKEILKANGMEEPDIWNLPTE